MASEPDNLNAQPAAGIAIGSGAQATVTITEEQSYNVAGLPNPYLGLRAFTAAEQDIFAGRERMVQALVKRLAAEDGDRLLCLVGASVVVNPRWRVRACSRHLSVSYEGKALLSKRASLTILGLHQPAH